MPKYEKCLLIPDIHAPFQDELALSALLDFSKWFKPDKIFILGDLVDFYAISRFTKDPERALKLQDEIDIAYEILKQIRNINPNTPIVLIRGNHEYRLQKYLWSEAKELSSLRDLSVENLLNLKSLDIKYEKTGRLIHRGVIIKHGDVVRKFSGYSAKGEFEKSGMSGVSGHTHRAAVYYQNNASGNYVWTECGCLCKLDAEYLEGEIPNWVQGWGVGYFSLNSPRYLLDFIPFVGGKAFYQGKEFI
jgi:UDP-2,3-diacylglucosamine pyrophosphatase LpxH